MSNVSTFGSFTMAKLGIYASQKGMQVTGNNITNINTAGYTRQSLDLDSLYVGGSDRYSSKWDAKMGSGVIVTSVSQIRSPYLDIRYRTENASVGKYETMLNGLNELGRVFDEVGDGEDGEGVMEAALQGLIEQMEYYTTEGAGRDDFDGILRGKSDQIVNIFNTYAGKLEDQFKNEETSFKQDVETVNTILKDIQSLNNSIRKAEIHGSGALELKDERNLKIDELSKYIRINVTYEEEDVGAGCLVDKLVIKLDSADDNKWDKSVYDPNNEGLPMHSNACLVNGKYVTQLMVPEIGVPPLKEGDEVPEYTEGQYDVYFDTLRDVQGEPMMDLGTRATYRTGNLVSAMGLPKAVGETVEFFGFSCSVSAQPEVPDGDLDPDELQQAQASANRKAAKEQLKEFIKAFNNEPRRTAPEGLTEEETAAFNAAEENRTHWIASLEKLGGGQYGLIFTAREVGGVNVTDDSLAQPDLRPDESALAGASVPEIPDDMELEDGFPQFVNGVADRVAQPKIELTDTDLYGSLQSSRELLTEKGEFATEADLARDPNAASKRGIPYYQKIWDQMAQQFAELLNNANSLVKTNADGTVSMKTYLDCNPNYTGTDPDPNDPVVKEENYYMYDFDQKLYVDEKGEPLADQTDPSVRVVREQFRGGILFSSSGDTDNIYKMDENGNYLDADGNITTDPAKYVTSITAKNISVSNSWAKGAVQLMQSRNDTPLTQSTDNSNLLHILSLMKDYEHPYTTTDKVVSRDENGNVIKDENGDPILEDKETVYFKGPFDHMLTKIASGLANDTAAAQDRMLNYYTSLTELTVDRDSVSGVDLNDEAISMMQYNKSYSAACRYMTQLDEMLDKLINGTAV